tara:strand:+ start:10485 stop:12320 length:1836 start_codon:yes stop_codon:yes gene_type:complete
MSDNDDINGNVLEKSEGLLKPKKKKTLVAFSNEINGELNKSYQDNPDAQTSLADLVGSASGNAKRTNKTTVPRIAFTEDPITKDNYFGLFKNKKRLLPDWTIKRIRQEDHLVASILRARGNTMSMFGRIRKDRFDIGLESVIKPEYDDAITPDQRIKIQERQDKALTLLMNCGSNEGVSNEDRILLSEYFYIQAQNGLSFGRHATEVIYQEDDIGDKMFHRFRPVDAGTIMRAVKKGEYADSVRQSSIRLLEEATGSKIDASTALAGAYSWIQVVDGVPRQAFTQDEMLISNLYPSTDIEHNGYPVTPLDTIMQAVTTHISIETYNKLYFANGRATKGLLIVQSDEIDQATIEGIKQQFNASINSVGNSFRTPIFGVGAEDNVRWEPMNQQKKDGEFQFLYDSVARNILSAFGMSPDELPGYGHLSKGTNQQSLSEANNEYKLTAARDTGIRPLILKFQDFINEELFPLIDPELAEICTIQLSGLDADTRQDEALRLQQDMPIHMTMDEVLDSVDKQGVGRHLAGDVDFNERYQVIVDKYLETSAYMGSKIDPAHTMDPMLKYRRDGFWFQQLEMMTQMNPAAVKAYFAFRPDAIELLKMLEQNMLDADSE